MSVCAYAYACACAHVCLLRACAQLCVCKYVHAMSINVYKYGLSTCLFEIILSRWTLARHLRLSSTRSATKSKSISTRICLLARRRNSRKEKRSDVRRGCLLILPMMIIDRGREWGDGPLPSALQNSYLSVTRLIYECGMTHSQVSHSFTGITVDFWLFLAYCRT